MQEKFTAKKFTKDEIIVKEGEDGNEAFFIKNGFAKVCKLSPEKKLIEIATLGPGQIFGEMCLLDNKPRSAYIIATSELEVDIIEKKDFTFYLDDTPDQMKIILNLLLKKLRESSKVISILKLEKDNLETQNKLILNSIKNLEIPT